MKWFYKNQRKLLSGLAIFMPVALVFGGLNLAFQSSVHDAALVVNGEKIPYSVYSLRFRQFEKNKPENLVMDANGIEAVRRETIQSLVQESVLAQVADKYDVLVPNVELGSFIRSHQAFQKDGHFDPGLYQSLLAQNGYRVPQDFEEEKRKALRGMKLQSLMASAIKVTPLELEWNVKRIKETGSADDKKILDDPRKFEGVLRQSLTRQALEQWFRLLQSQVRTQVLLDRFEAVPAGK